MAQSRKPFRLLPSALEELEQILQLPRGLPLQEPLSMSRRLRIPPQNRLFITSQMSVQPRKQLLPRLTDHRLVKQPIHHETVVPMRLVASFLIVPRHMVEISVPGAHKCTAESTCPTCPPLRVPDHLLGVRAGRAPVGVLVMLVEGVGAPEGAIAVRAGVALVSLVEFILMPLPVELALETDVTEGAPVRTLGLGGTAVVDFRSWY